MPDDPHRLILSRTSPKAKKKHIAAAFSFHPSQLVHAFTISTIPLSSCVAVLLLEVESKKCM